MLHDNGIYYNREYGALEIGMRANLVILDKSPFEAKNLQIVALWRDGEEIKVS